MKSPSSHRGALALIKEDFYPKRPTRESLLSALPEIGVAAYLAVALASGVEEAQYTIFLEMPFLLFLFFGLLAATSESRFVRWFGTIWVSLMFLGVVLVGSALAKQWGILLGIVTLLVAHLPTFVRREKWLHREMLWARAGVRLALLWGLFAVIPYALAPLGDRVDHDTGVRIWFAIWGASYFVAAALLDLFRILVPPDPNAGPGWWK